MCRLSKSSWYKLKLQKNNSELNYRSLIALTTILLKLKKQKLSKRERRSKELRETRKDLQPK